MAQKQPAGSRDLYMWPAEQKPAVFCKILICHKIVLKAKTTGSN